MAIRDKDIDYNMPLFHKNVEMSNYLKSKFWEDFSVRGCLHSQWGMCVTIKQEICQIPADIQRSGRFWCPACRLYVQLRASDQNLSRRPPTLTWPPARTNDDRNAPDLGLVYLCWPACPRRSGAWFTAHPATWDHGGGGGGGAIPRARLTLFVLIEVLLSIYNYFLESISTFTLKEVVI